ncbi:MAG: VCBS repeat-containing protein [Sandaracinus sp.]
MASRLTALVLVLSSLAGCHLAHTRPERTGEPSPDAARGDAAAIDAGHDGGAPEDASDAAAPLVPRLLSPLSTSRATSRRPTLRFLRPAGAASVRVELCIDRTCLTHHEVLTTDADRVRPTNDLPPGWLYWRVVTPTGVSATWELIVPTRETGTDTAWGVGLELDGDGYGEEVRDVESGGEVSSGIFHGSPSGYEPEPRTLVPPSACHARSLALAAGDLDGDGLGDLLLADSPDWCRPGIVRVLLGGQLPITTTPQRELTDFEPTRPGYGRFALGLGDLDGDGYGDLAIGVRERFGSLGSLTAEIFRGGPTGIASERGERIVVDDLSVRSERPPLAAADFDGDRLADLVVGPSVYLGGRGLDAPSFTLDRQVKAVAVGDVDGDGYADWAAASDVVDPTVETARVSVFHGGPSGIGGMPRTFLVGPDQYFGNEVTLADVDHDGFDDLTVWAPLGASVTYRGSPTGLIIP